MRMNVRTYGYMYVCKLYILVLQSIVQYFAIRVTEHSVYMFANMPPLNIYLYKRRVFGKRRKI